MFNQIEGVIVTKLVQQLNSHGINVSEETVKQAIANSPQIVAQVEAILATPGTQDKVAKITALIKSASTTTDNK